jgi:uncharacterized membrane protein YoaK (UPF0700 family)
MFSQEGSARSSLQNRLLAGCLAGIGGFVNSCGFVLIGTFTSHVTGNVGRLADDAALGHFASALAALSMVLVFFGGAFVVSLIVESHLFDRKPAAYAAALSAEALLLAVFSLLSFATAAAHPRVKDAEGLLLCAAMGMQNGLVTRLSGAVVRTTHLTGVVTDLGIESARWVRHFRSLAAEATNLRFLFGGDLPERPNAEKIVLLATIAGSFLTGATCGATAAVHLRHASMLLPAVALVSFSLYARRRGPNEDDSTTSRR